jgi:cytochrome c oxidase assembly factor CtaG
MTALAAPFSFHFHPFWWLAIAVTAIWYIQVTRLPDRRSTRRQQIQFFAGLAVLAVAVTWPLGDLAAHWSLVALVLQRLLLMLAVPPLLILGTPVAVLAALTRPAPIDAIVRTCAKPAVAVIIVTVVSVGTLTTGAVDAQSTTLWARGLISLLVLWAGFVLWSPVLTHLPGVPRPSTLGRAGYLIVQSIVPSFLSIVWIFAHHPLYPVFNHASSLVGISPLLDQQLAGFIAKLTTIAVLWTVAFSLVSRAETEDVNPQPLIWADVERELERAERRERRSGESTSHDGVPPGSAEGGAEPRPPTG